MAKEESFLMRLIGRSRDGGDTETPEYPQGMTEAARKARKRLKQSGILQIELDAQREINGRVSQFGKAA